jgi:hypothetical protein
MSEALAILHDGKEQTSIHAGQFKQASIYSATTSINST